MYNTPFTRMDDHDEIVALVREVGVGNLVTVGVDGVPEASLLPLVWDGGDVVVAHAARANEQFARLLGADVSAGDGHDGTADVAALLVVDGPDAYINPSWYPSTATSHRSVPTWNYQQVQLRGRLRLHEDAEWLLSAVRSLSDRHVEQHAPYWHFDDMPAKFLDGQLRGIIGLEFCVEEVQGKAKLSANRVEADRLGVIAGLDAEDSPRSHAIAEVMRRREHG